MFGNKLKQKIQRLEVNYTDVCEQLQTVTEALQKRQEEVINLERKNSKFNREDVEALLKEVLTEEVENYYIIVKKDINEEFVECAVDEIIGRLFDNE